MPKKAVIENPNLIWNFRIYRFTVTLNESASRTKSIFIQTLKVGANDRSAQELQNGL
jgi:hypothetical protein